MGAFGCHLIRQEGVPGDLLRAHTLHLLDARQQVVNVVVRLVVQEGDGQRLQPDTDSKTGMKVVSKKKEKKKSSH